MRQKKLLFALVAFLALASAACAKLQARDNLNKGVRAFRDAKYETAIDFFQEAIKLDPELIDAEVYLATAYSQQFIPGAQSEENRRHAQMAIEAYERVLQRAPDNVSAIAGLAFIYQNTVELDKAREYYLKHSQLAPTDPLPFYAVGSVNWITVSDKNNPRPEDEQAVLVDQGLEYLDKALALNPDYEDAMAYKNLLYREKARLTADEEEKNQFIAMADDWYDRALETRRKNQEKSAVGGVIVGQ